MLSLGDKPPVSRFAGMNQVYGVATPGNSTATIKFLGTLAVARSRQVPLY